MNIKQFIKKQVFFNISRTWDGKNHETTKSHDANIVLFGFLRINPHWRSFDDDGLYLSLYVGIITNKGHTQVFNLQVYPKFEFTSPGIRRWWKRTINYYKIKKLEQQIMELEQTCHNICSDPMCGCPDDFAYDYSRRISHLEHRICELMY